MTFRAVLAAAALTLLAPNPARAADPVAINPDSYFPEGPVWSDGKLFYVEYGKDRVMVWDGATNHEVWAEKGCGANGLAILPDKTMWVACNTSNAIAHVTSEGKTLEERTADTTGLKFNGPNDLALDGKGGMYITSNGDADRDKPIDGFVSYLRPDGTIVQVADHLWFANGVVVADQGRKLIVSETIRHDVVSFDIKPDGTLGDMRLFARMQDIDDNGQNDVSVIGGPDSMRIDSHGNIYIAQYGAGRILVVTPEGKKVRVLNVPKPFIYTANCALSPDEQTIYIAAARDQDNAPYPGTLFKLENR